MERRTLEVLAEDLQQAIAWSRMLAMQGEPQVGLEVLERCADLVRTLQETRPPCSEA